MIDKIFNSKYKILELIGQGGMAKVYKAQNLINHQIVAIKVLNQEFTEDEQILKKFLREAQADAKLVHNNIVNITDVGIDRNNYYLVMEYISGDTLKKYIRTRKKLDLNEVVEILIGVANGIRHAHKNNILHRDIKPHNILLTENRKPKVADFGIARDITSSTITTDDALGSVHYISPEQAKGVFLDEKSDLYSFGIMMYELLTSQLPYNGDSSVSVALMHVQNNVPNPKNIMKSLPDGLCQIVLNLTRRKPNDRYKNTDELLEDLNKVKYNKDAYIYPTYNHNINTDDYSGFIPVEKKNKKSNVNLKIIIPVFVTIITLCVLIVISILNKVEVPNIEGMKIEDAVVVLVENDLRYEIVSEIIDDKVAKDVIISQNPKVGEKIDKNDIISLVVSEGPNMVNVPKCIGLNELDAVKLIEDGKLITNEIIYEYNDDYSAGIVFRQYPLYNEKLKLGEAVTLYVSKGDSAILMPKLTGLSLDDARSVLQEHNLIMGEIKYEANEFFNKGEVISQNPLAFNDVYKNTIVDVVVSLGATKDKQVTFKLEKMAPEGVDNFQVKVIVYPLTSEQGREVYNAVHTKNDTVKFNVRISEAMVYKVFINQDELEVHSGAITY